MPRLPRFPFPSPLRAPLAALAMVLGLVAPPQPAQAATTGLSGFSGVYGIADGTAINQNLRVVFSPAPALQGQTGSYYVAVPFQNQWFFLTPGGWQTYSGQILPLATGPLAARQDPVLGNANVSALECTPLYAGYGTSLDAMLQGGTFAQVYKVPAAADHAAPLPCSRTADADLVRFLEQATFGASNGSLDELRQLGVENWLSRQFSLPITLYPDLPVVPLTRADSCTGTCARDGYSVFPVQLSFFQNALTAQDQLRQRVAFSLGQILVVSGNTVSYAYAMGPYQNLLLTNALGNFEDLLLAVTLSPTMGRYLNMANNDKPDPKVGRQANENYARELMQLFSMGLYQLNPDGSIQRDAQGRPLASYDQPTVTALARVFTGWTYPPMPDTPSQNHNPQYYRGTLVAVESLHDTDAKQIGNLISLPAGQKADADLRAAVHAVFMHPNVGPFIGRRLIQHLVKGNPSAAYVSRVASTFNDNGQGVRGDMQAVVRAILLDPEARGDMRGEADAGHLRPPILLATQLLRSLGGYSDGVWLRSQTANLGQEVFNSPSVFNFFSPDFPVSGYTEPEFGIDNAASALARSNFIYSLIYGGGAGPDSSVIGATGTKVDLAPWQILATSPAALVDRLDVLLMHGTMTPSLRQNLITQVSAVPANDPLSRARLAIYLLATSPSYLVER